MAPDELQQAWQAEASQTRVTVNADLLLRQVRRNQSDLRAIVFRRDTIEVVVVLLLLPYWFYAGHTHALPWTWYLAVPALIWVGGFIVVYRWSLHVEPLGPDEPLVQCAESALTELDNQIWLLRNVFWWYLLPLGAAIAAFFIQVAWQSATNWLETLVAVPLVGFIVALYYLIYCLNQRAVRRQLAPRREELLELLAGLYDDPIENRAQSDKAADVKPAGLLKRLVIFACLCFVCVMAVRLAYQLSVDRGGTGYPRLAPYSAVRWQESQPEIRIDGQWYKLVSLDDIPSDEIVAFSKKTYGDRWQMRFEEDLVEVLSRMGHPPKETVTLVVQPLTSSKTQVLKDVPMTAKNRAELKAAVRVREESSKP